MGKTLLETLAELGDGDFEAQATRLFREVAEAVEEHGGTGKLTITLAIAKEKRMAVVKPSFKITKPMPPTDPTMFYVAEDGQLSREDPRQLNLKQVPRRPAEVVDIPRRTPDKNGDTQ